MALMQPPMHFAGCIGIMGTGKLTKFLFTYCAIPLSPMTIFEYASALCLVQILVDPMGHVEAMYEIAVPLLSITIQALPNMSPRGPDLLCHHPQTTHPPYQLIYFLW